MVTHMSNFNIGDTVRVGKTGKVEYQVIDITDKGVYVSSGKSNRTVPSENLTLVKAAKVTVTLHTDEPLAVGEAEVLAPEGAGDVLLVVDGTVTRHKSVGNAAFILSRKNRNYKNAGIIRDGQYRATRVGIAA